MGPSLVELLRTLNDLLDREEAHGRQMLRDPYYTDAFFPGGPRNVGADVLAAVAALRDLRWALQASPRINFAALLRLVAEAKRAFAVAAPDPDGFGLATFNRVLHALEAAATQAGETLPESAEQLARSAAHMVAAEMYARGVAGQLTPLVDLYRALPAERRGDVDVALRRQLDRDRQQSPRVALQTVDLVRAFYRRVGREDQEAALLSEKMALLAALEPRPGE